MGKVVQSDGRSKSYSDLYCTLLFAGGSTGVTMELTQLKGHPWMGALEWFCITLTYRILMLSRWIMRTKYFTGLTTHREGLKAPM